MEYAPAHLSIIFRIIGFARYAEQKKRILNYYRNKAERMKRFSLFSKEPFFKFIINFEEVSQCIRKSL